MKPRDCPYHYTKVADGFVAAFRSFDFSAQEIRILAWVLEHTYGTECDGTEWARVSGSKVGEKTGIERTRVNKLIRKLVNEHVLLERKTSKERRVRMCKNMRIWKVKLLTKIRPKLTLIGESSSTSPRSKVSPPVPQGEASSTSEVSPPVPQGEVLHASPEASSTSPSTGKEASKHKPSSLTEKKSKNTPRRVEEKEKREKSDLLDEVNKVQTVQDACNLAARIPPSLRDDSVRRWLSFKWNIVTRNDLEHIDKFLATTSENINLILPALVKGTEMTRDHQEERVAQGREPHSRPLLKNLDFARQSLQKYEILSNQKITVKPGGELKFFDLSPDPKEPPNDV